MKKYALIKYFFILSVIFSLNSCGEDDDSEFIDAVSPENLEWQANTNITVTPVEDKNIFVVDRQVLGGALSWANDTVEFNMDLNSILPIDDFASIDFYLTAEELNGYNYTGPYDTSGKLYQTVLSSEMTEDGKFNIEIIADEAAILFQNEYQNSRPEIALLEGDLFELHWVIKANNGTIYDSRDYVESDTRFGFTVRYDDIAPLIWDGIFEYEWTYTSAGAESWGAVYVGKTGLTIITPTSPGLYDSNDVSFDYYYGGPGSITFDYLTGLTAIVDTSWREQKWEILSVGGPTLEINGPTIIQIVMTNGV